MGSTLTEPRPSTSVSRQSSAGSSKRRWSLSEALQKNNNIYSRYYVKSQTCCRYSNDNIKMDTPHLALEDLDTLDD
jgi:hypothetical protein